ncbi:substrate-binding periplasmic protein [Neorhizobium sp. NPDC001467]|uniref:substrate-binding periplasmic protein n=1 Tax=Neorhizobium sp. NPDC001467 TaxID=3390595 RepID=UPI003D035CDD
MKAAALTIGMILAAGQVVAQETLQFTTESYPPFIIQEPKQALRGISVDQVREILEGSGLDYRIEIMPWARAIALAETQRATCAFSAAQTADRRVRFRWVMPLARSISILVRRRNADIAATTLEEARRFTVGTHRSDYTETVLQKLKFPKIDVSASFDVTLAKLFDNRIDLMPMSQDVYEQLRARGVEIEKVTQLAQHDLGIACNRSVSWQVIQTMQTRLNRLIATGRQAEIYRSYGLAPPD